MNYLKRNNFFIFLGLLILLSLVAFLPLFHKGFFQSDDGDWMIIRFTAFHQALKSGEFPVRYLGRLNQEYGYPVTDFLYPLFLYIAEVFHLLRFGFVESIKLVIGLSLLASSLFSFLWLRRLFGNFSAFIGGLFALYLPYHLYTTYTRGSVGEVLALGIVPFVLYSLERRRRVLATIGIFLLLLSHNTLAILFLPLLFLYMTLCTYDEETEQKGFSAYRGIFELGIGMAAFFWLPALYDLRYTIFSQTVISDWSHYFASPALIGYGVLALLLLSLVLLFFTPLRSAFRTEINPHQANLFMFFLIIGLAVVFFSTPLSSTTWKFLPVSFIQFPFRLLSLLTIVGSYLVAFFISYLKKGQYVIGCLVLATLLLSYPYLLPKNYENQSDEYYSTNVDTTTVHHEYLPLWVKQIPSSIPKEVVVDDSVQNLISKDNSISFTTDEKNERVVTLNKIYFPGWKATVDSKPTKISYQNPRGLMQVTVPQGQHTVMLSFTETPVRYLADVISILSLLILGAMSVLGKRKKRV